MLTAFLDRLGGLFDRRFIVAFWAPTFLTAFLAALTVLALRPGLGTALETWARLTANAQIILRPARCWPSRFWPTCSSP
ncbi:MAG: hypothetical protein IPO15_16330 [Anaerolineae bacterium]|uniref:hypothetical protein n=1 Tax=Candidatus Amarolinea dominans TaxID=3140696 RepID=UPI0031364A5B|nr:hypothetical protein [Anaerolineae bacterium]